MPYEITQCYLPPSRGDFPAELTWVSCQRWAIQRFVNENGWLMLVVMMMMNVISHWQFVVTAGSDGHESAGRAGTVYVTACLVTANCRQLWQIYQHLLQS